MRATNDSVEKTVRTPFQKFHGPWQRERGLLEFEDANAAVDALIGLTIGDQQVRRLLGVLPMPGPGQIEARADRAVARFSSCLRVPEKHDR
jgi:transcriptional repressor AefR-like protein